jgi:hypothetical protein
MLTTRFDIPIVEFHHLTSFLRAGKKSVRLEYRNLYHFVQKSLKNCGASFKEYIVRCLRLKIGTSRAYRPRNLQRLPPIGLEN